MSKLLSKEELVRVSINCSKNPTSGNVSDLINHILAQEKEIEWLRSMANAALNHEVKDE